jgi:hypothetical protein
MQTIFKDQKPMTLEEENDLIEKNLVDLVYNAAYLEGVRTSFVEARAFILEGTEPSGPRPTGLKKLKNLKTAYMRLMEKDMLDEPTDLATLCELNRIVNGRGVSDEPGRVRSVAVTISGTEYVPQIPDPYTVNNTIRDIVEQKKTFIERGLDLYCYLMREQVFVDGNKRSANLLCNQFLLRHGQGIFSIRPERNDEFLQKLVSYYESGDPTDLKIYIYENCFYTDPTLPYIDD